MKKREYLLYIISIITLMAYLSCATGDKEIPAIAEKPDAEYSVYIINKNIHTGLIIPLNRMSMSSIRALSYFAGSEYADFGWGEEAFYQKPGAKFCLGIKAVAIPSSSVMRVEGFGSYLEDVVNWSGFAVELKLTEIEFKKICEYINSSFKLDDKGELMETSRKRGGAIIFFKSVYLYHMFNTCNTWIARTLQYSGLQISPLFIITADNLYNEVKRIGVVLKSPRNGKL